MNANYTKLKDGTWGVRVSGRVSVGQEVTVTKKSGEVSHETVSVVLWTGIAKDGAEASLVKISQRSTGRGRMGPGHGSAPQVRGYSSYCTDNASCRCYDCAS